jgi:hypothetical protein
MVVVPHVTCPGSAEQLRSTALHVVPLHETSGYVPQWAMQIDLTPLSSLACSTGAGVLEHSAGAKRSGGMAKVLAARTRTLNNAVMTTPPSFPVPGRHREAAFL